MIVNAPAGIVDECFERTNILATEDYSFLVYARRGIDVWEFFSSLVSWRYSIQYGLH
jgi:hypothetical protein